MNDDTISRGPVGRGSDLVLITELEGIDYSQNFVELTTGRRGIGEGQADLFGWVDNVDRSDSEWDTVRTERGTSVHEGQFDAFFSTKLTPLSPSWSNLVRRACPIRTEAERVSIFLF